MITRRENLLRVLRHEMPEWIPICSHVDPYNQPNRAGMDPELAEALGKVTWGGDGCVTLSRYLDMDILDWGCGVPCRRTEEPFPPESRTEGDDTITIVHTPKGDLRQVLRQCREDGTAYYVEHFVKTPDDLPRLAMLFEGARFEPNPAGMERCRQRSELIGDDGILGAAMSSTPLGMFIRVYAGVEATSLILADAPDAVRDTFAVMAENHLNRLRVAVQSTVDVFITVDDTSTSTISPRMFEQHGMAYTDRAADIVHAAGKYYMHHSCGLIRDLLGLYRQTKMDCVHAFTVPPVGNVTVREGKERLGPNIAIAAGIPALEGSLADWDTVRRNIRRIFEDAAPGDNFIGLLSAYPDKTVEQTRRVLDECRRYQNLPERARHGK